MEIKKISELINELPFDLRIELVLEDLISHGFSANDLFVKPTGLFKRRFSKDIQSIETLEIFNQKVFLFNTPREGLYDTLPQSIFHNAPSKATKFLKSTSEMIKDYKKRLEEERDSRNFFMIYEFEFFSPLFDTLFIFIDGNKL